ncbi:hypothetical protein Btru_068425 [Bulinus truncatus]|nr:hypothetical protein Btru_068425 [Bulinus truncatus]
MFQKTILNKQKNAECSYRREYTDKINLAWLTCDWGQCDLTKTPFSPARTLSSPMCEAYFVLTKSNTQLTKVDTETVPIRPYSSAGQICPSETLAARLQQSTNRPTVNKTNAHSYQQGKHQRSSQPRPVALCQSSKVLLEPVEATALVKGKNYLYWQHRTSVRQWDIAQSPRGGGDTVNGVSTGGFVDKDFIRNLRKRDRRKHSTLRYIKKL